MPTGLVQSSRYRIFLLWRGLISVPLLGAYAIFFTGQVVIGMLSALWAIWITDLGGSYVYLGATFTVFALPQIFFGAIAGRASDRWGRGPLLLISGMLISLIYVAYGFTASLVVIIVLGAVEGLILIFQLPAAQSLLADASPAAARGRVQGVAGFAGAIGGAGSAYASLPLYHSNHGLPFILVGVVMAIGSILGAMGAAVLTRRQSGRPCA